MIGFTFDGRHSSEFGCYHVPPAASRGSDMEDYSIVSQEIDGRDGGYYVGHQVGVREIQLECYVEEVNALTRER